MKIIYYKHRDREGFAEQVGVNKGLFGHPDWPIIDQPYERIGMRQVALNPELTETRDATPLEIMAFECGRQHEVCAVR